MAFLRRLVGGDDGDEEGEGDALLDHEGYSSSALSFIENHVSSVENHVKIFLPTVRFVARQQCIR